MSAWLKHHEKIDHSLFTPTIVTPGKRTPLGRPSAHSIGISRAILLAATTRGVRRNGFNARFILHPPLKHEPFEARVVQFLFASSRRSKIMKAAALQSVGGDRFADKFSSNHSRT
jgi:hypothetical protein